jgi:hypothetical protein
MHILTDQTHLGKQWIQQGLHQHHDWGIASCSVLASALSSFHAI